ncbi:MAG: T9SS type A sorting domain-containing protein [Bacteroidetes bacterium]|nr:T9SS type A sorting domain-containing protein [Bacteroidota bacterium]
MKKLFTLASLLCAAISSNAQTITNGAMDNFHTVQIAGTNPAKYTQAPSSWYGLDSFAISLAATYIHQDTGYKAQIASSATAHTAAPAAQITTKDQDTLGIIAGCLSNCAPKITGIPNANNFLSVLSFSGGQDISANAHRPGTIGVWIEYAPVGNDTAHIIARVLNAGDSIIGQVDSMITSTVSMYTYVTPHITYSGPMGTGPKKLQIILTSSTLGGGNVGSVLYADDVNYTIATGIEQPAANGKAVKFYPNPSAGIVYLYSNLSEKLSWQVFNANGQVIINKTLASANREDLSYLPAGTYFFNVIDSKGEVVQKDKFTLVK